MSNAEIVRRLRAEARNLACHRGNLYRVRAYRQAALALTSLPGEVAVLGPEALRAAGLGERMAKTVYEWALSAVEPVPSS